MELLSTIDRDLIDPNRHSHEHQLQVDRIKEGRLGVNEELLKYIFDLVILVWLETAIFIRCRLFFLCRRLIWVQLLNSCFLDLDGIINITVVVIIVERLYKLGHDYIGPLLARCFSHISADFVLRIASLFLVFWLVLIWVR